MSITAGRGPLRRGGRYGRKPRRRRSSARSGRFLFLLSAPSFALNPPSLPPPPSTPRRAVRPKTAAEKEFCALGPVAEAFITGAAGAGNTRLGPELAELNTLRAAHGEEAFGAALDRAAAFGRWRAADVRSILAAGPGTADPRPAGDVLVLELPVVPVRPLSAISQGRPTRR